MKYTLNEFQNSSLRTAPFKGEPQNNEEKRDILMNYTLGLSGEFIEFDLENPNNYYGWLKEAGDVLHYAVVLMHILGIKTKDEQFGKVKVGNRNAYKSIMMATETIKKTYYHGHEFDYEKFVSSVKNIIDHVYDKLGEYNFHLALELNIEKLKKRYPLGFSKEDSVNRKG
jgi:NTP pyrophosphatase (non-canonical NTP hydrolase)